MAEKSCKEAINRGKKGIDKSPGLWCFYQLQKPRINGVFYFFIKNYYFLLDKYFF
jgi:hypothetical protein